MQSTCFPATNRLPRRWQRSLRLPRQWVCDSVRPASRAVLIDLLRAMHRGGPVRGTAQQLAELARCQVTELLRALDDLHVWGAAEVRLRGEVISVRCPWVNAAWRKRERWRRRWTRSRREALHAA